MEILFLFIVFVVTAFIGYRTIKNVPALLHTPLMSGMNALSGITLLGALTAAGFASSSGSRILGLIVIILASVNIFGGFLVTDKMLKMFRSGSEASK